MSVLVNTVISLKISEYTEYVVYVTKPLSPIQQEFCSLQLLEMIMYKNNTVLALLH